MENIEKLLSAQTEKLSKLIDATEKKLSDKIDAFATRLEEVETLAKKNLNSISVNTIAIQENKVTTSNNANDINETQTNLLTITTENTERDQRIDKLEAEVSSLKLKNEDLELVVNVHTEMVEDQTNRNLRKNIIIRGIPEGKEEVSWEDTRAVVANALGKACNIHPNNIGDMFERLHRGSKREGDDGNNYPRAIFGLLYNWNNVDHLMKELRKHGKDSKIYIDQQFGPITTYRRKLALDKRKTLKDAKTITSGWIKYPAKLMVRYGEKTKYVMSEDFSKKSIPIEEYIKNLKSPSVENNR